MEVEFKISKDELVDFHMKHVGETTVYKYQMISCNIYYILMLLGILFLLIHDLGYIITGIITWFILFIFRKKILKYKLRKKFLKIYSFDKYTSLFELTHLSITEDGLKFRSNLFEKIYKWGSIKSVNLVDQYILIRTINNEDLLISIFAFKPFENKEIFIERIIKNTELELKNGYPKDIKYI